MELTFKEIDGGICASEGILAAGMHCGIRKNKSKLDIALVAGNHLCDCAGVYTQNKVKGAPLKVTKKNLENGKARAVIVNSGIANTCAPDGEEKALQMCNLTAQALDISSEDVIVASTGVIGPSLPIEPIAKNIGTLVDSLSKEGHDDASHAIMTTDTHNKEYAVEFELDGKVCHIGGMAKGSGMIHPNMATMLCFLSTDVQIASSVLQKMLKDVVDVTFNMVSVDGDTSTNDMVTILATGEAGNAPIEEASEDYHAFQFALKQVMMVLSKEIARDGEGATKLIQCTVNGAKDHITARVIAKSIITSDLVKTAMFGADANWGRILCAIGYADGDFEIDNIKVVLTDGLDEILVCEQGRGVEFSEEKARDILIKDEVEILVYLDEGNCSATAWGCDLSYEYVRINGDYRT